MKHKYIAYLLAIIIGLPSCVEDKGSNAISPINEFTISGIEKEYNMITSAETLVITPEIKTSLKEVDESQLAYQWFLCKGASLNEKHITIGTEKKLEYLLSIPPGTYTLYFEVLDKSNGIKWEKSCKLNASTPFVRGFYLFGDKEDGICGMDYVSIINERDTTVAKDVFINSLQIKGAQNLIFTGNYDEISTSLWAITKSGSYSIEYSSSLAKFDIRKDISTDKFIYPTIEVTKPLKIVEIHPHAYGSDNFNTSMRNRALMTENEFFATSLYTEEAYGNPLNRYSATTAELYKPSPYVFYLGNTASVSRAIFFDETHQRFVGLNSTLSFAAYCKNLADDGSIFFLDQTKYTPSRQLIYGENGYGNAGRSYALMTDTDGQYYIYGFIVSTTPTKQFAITVNQSIAQHFAQASQYAFFSMQSIILYSVGSQLWAYDYNRQEGRMMKDFGSEITYLAMDYHSNNTPTDFIVATYSDSEKGTVSKFTIADDQNKIEITPHENEVWKTDLRVIKVEYRKSSL